MNCLVYGIYVVVFEFFFSKFRFCLLNFMFSVLFVELKEDKWLKVIGIRSLLLLVDMFFDFFLKDCFGGGVVVGDRRKMMIKDLVVFYWNDC